MIEGITGLPGAGKTLWTVARMLREVKRGRRVIANFGSTRGLWETGLWADMIEEYQALCVIDEAQMWFSAREWTKTKQLELGVFQQHRKNGLDLWWIAQHQNRVDVGIREITAYIWKITRVGRVLLAAKYQPDDLRHRLGVKLWWVNPAVFAEYDTFEIVGDREGNGHRSGRGRREASEGPGRGAVTPGRQLARYDLRDGLIRYRWHDEVAESPFDASLRSGVLTLEGSNGNRGSRN